VRFFINKTGEVGGPSIFGSRLKKALIEHGWKWDRLFPVVSYIFSSGMFRPFCKNILRLDGLYFDSENTIGDSDRKNRPILRAYEKADGIIFQSEFDRKLFKYFVGEANCPMTVIPNGAPSDFSPVGPKIDYGFNKTLLCSSQWRAHKRLKCIITSFLEYGDPTTGLVILGNSSEKVFEHPNIKYVGRIHPSKLPEYLRGGDAFIHLSWLDHCPNSVVEALCCGLPVLCTHNGGTREIVRDNGVIIKCEEDYNFKKVALYNPPKCEEKTVAAGIEKILAWNKTVDASNLRINHIASKYAELAKSLSEE